MKPILLHGHERAVTQIKYNREGDLLFSCAKDNEPNVWYSVNGERLGTFQGHEGAVWTIDVDWDSRNVLTGAADNMLKLWDCETGKCLNTVDTKTAVRSCGFSYSGRLIFFTTDRAMGHPCEMRFYDITDGDQMANDNPFLVLEPESKVTSAVWGPLDDYIVTGHEDGTLNKWDIKAGTKTQSVQDHKATINDLQTNLQRTMIVSASRDTRAALFDMESLEMMYAYKTERPVNSAAVSPNMEHICLGGGQDAMDVTRTSARVGKFDAKFFNLVFEEEFGRVKDHFGPVNTVAFHPDGKSYSSGGEDGYVRVHTFDQAYYDFNMDY